MANSHRKGDVARTSHPPVPAPAAPPPSSASRPRAYKTPGRGTQDGSKNDLVVRLGQLLRAARLRRGYSQEDLAQHSHVHRTHISLVEVGTRDSRITTICALAAALRVNPGDLMPVLFLPDKAAIAPPAPPAPTTPPPPAHL